LPGIILVFLSTALGYSQPDLIAEDRNNNLFPITFTDVNQKIIVLTFDEDITQAGVSSAYNVQVGGAPATISYVTPGSFLGYGNNQLVIGISNSISFANRFDVFVTYTQPGTPANRLQGVGGDAPSFTNIQAYNNLLLDCSHVSSFANAPVTDGDCQPLTITLEGTFVWEPYARNSVYFEDLTVRAWIVWQNDPFASSTPALTETVEGSGVFTYSETFTYPEQEVCFFEPYVYPRSFFSNGSFPYQYNEDGQLRCNVGNQIKRFRVSAFCTDNRLTGEMNIDDPPEGIEYCVGSDIPGVQFSDATEFNCRIELPIVETDDDANRGTRWAQFVYSTHSVAGIPNVGLIRGVGDTVWVTDNNGDPITFPTPSGFFEGPVDVNPFPSTDPISTTYPIYHKGNFDTDEAGDIFEVTMRIWNTCNPYTIGWQFDGDPSTNPIEETAYLILVESPPPPTVPDKTICFGGNTELSVSGSPVADVFTWYSNSDRTGKLTDGNSYDPGVTDSNTYSYYVTDRETSGFLCESEATEVQLLIKDELTLTGPITGPADVCQNETGITFSVPAPTYTASAPDMTNGGETEIHWTVPAGWNITAGQGTREITVDAAGTVAEDLTVTAEWRYVDATCGSTLSFDVDVNKIPEGTPPPAFTICENTTLNINPQDYTDVASSTFAWSGDNSSSGTGIIDDDPTNATTAQILITYTVTPTGPTGCVGSDFDILVNVDPETDPGTLAYAAGQDEICLGEDVDLNITGYVGSIERYRWRRDGGSWSGQNSAADTYSYTPAQAGTWEFQARVQSGQCNEEWGNIVSVIVHPTTVGGAVTPNRTVCQGLAPKSRAASS